MRLTNPAALWGLLLLMVPPLLARMRAPRPRRVVANLYLWQELARRDHAGLTLRRHRRDWLVAIQVLVLLAVVVALAGPVLALPAPPAAQDAALGAPGDGVGGRSGHLSLTRLVARRNPLRPSSGDVLVEARNFGPEARDARIELEQDGRVVGRQAVRVPAGGIETTVLPVAELGQLLSARLVTDDARAVDSQRFAAVPDASPVRVLLQTRGRFFLEKVLAANPAIALDTMTWPAHVSQVEQPLLTATGRRADVVVCDGCTEAPGTGESALVLLPAGRAQPPSPLTIARPDHPLVSSLEFREWLVAPLLSANAPMDGEIVLRAGGQPVAIAYERQGQRILELRLDVGDQGLVLQTGFPILMANAIAWLAARDENRLAVTLGDSVRWRLAGAFAPDQVSVTAPDGHRIDSRVEGRLLTVTRTDAAGPYRVRTPFGDQIFVVNPSVRPVPSLSKERPTPAPGGGGPEQTHPAREQELAQWLLALACGLLAVESHYARVWLGRLS